MNKISKLDEFVTIILDLQFFESNADIKLIRLIESLKKSFFAFEIIVIANGISDENYEKIERTLFSLPNIRVLKLVSRVNFDTSVVAGLDNAIGDYIVIFDLYNDPLDLIYHMVKRNKLVDGFIIGINKNSKISVWQKIFNKLTPKIPHNATMARSLSRHCVNVLLKTGEYHHNLYQRLHKLDLSFDILEYNTSFDYKDSEPNLKSIFRIIVYGNVLNLRKIYIFGFLIALIGMFLKSNLVNAFIFLLFALLFVGLGFLAELILRLINILNQKEKYIISKESLSKINLADERVNVKC